MKWTRFHSMGARIARSSDYTARQARAWATGQGLTARQVAEVVAGFRTEFDLVKSEGAVSRIGLAYGKPRAGNKEPNR
jgi:hypothetical protein